MVTELDLEDRTGYNFFNEYSQISYNIISYLITNNELIWKLLKYHTRDAWNKADLTQQEKAQLIYSGQDDSTNFFVFMDEGNPDVHTREDCIVRVSPSVIYPENRTVATLSVHFETYAHYKVNTLSNYTTRVDTITQEALKTLNGARIDGIIGRLYFDRLASMQARVGTSGQIPFKGRSTWFSAKMG